MRIVLATVGALAVAPAANATTTISYYAPGQSAPPSGSTFGLDVRGDSASERVTARVLANPFRFRVSAFKPDGSFAPMVAGEGCSFVTTSAGDTGVECTERGAILVTAFLGDGDDSFTEATFPDVSLFGVLDVDGGGGNDKINGGRGNDNLRGSAGNDELRGFSGNDRLAGQAGNDSLIGDDGADELDGDIGADELNGGTGADKLRGGTGGDRLNARDGVLDATVDCGLPSGFFQADSADVDLNDKVVIGCEFVERRAIDDGRPGAPVGRRLRVRQDGLATVQIACPRAAQVRCRGRVSVRAPERPVRALASASYRVPLGSRRQVVLKLTPAERALLCRRGRSLVTTRENGISRLGPRSAQRTLRVACS